MTYRSVGERVGGELFRLEAMKDKTSSSIRVSMPALIKEIDYERMVISAQPCIKEKIRQSDGTVKDISLPVIEDIPLVYPSAGGFSITFPVSINDECLLVFADFCIDSWWQSGGLQTQFESRRHDLSDCFAIPSQMSQAKKINNFNSNSLEIKNNATGMKIEVQGDTIKIGGIDILAFKQAFDSLKQTFEQHSHT